MPHLRLNRWVTLRDIRLRPVEPSLGGPIDFPDRGPKALSLNFKIPSGKAADWAGKREDILTDGVPYAFKVCEALA